MFQIPHFGARLFYIRYPIALVDDINFVRENYRLVAKEYLEDKDPTQGEIKIFRTWLSQVSQVLELGCGSGFPVAEVIISTGKDYIGIDLSPDQIRLAQSRYPQWSERFIEAEMLSFTRSQDANIFDGVVSMFAIRHLPRVHHVELYTQISRILRNGGLFLVDHPKYSEDGKDSWFGGKPMYWSSFSLKWQQLTLKEIGFDLIEEFEDVKMFNGKEERTLFALYQI